MTIKHVEQVFCIDTSHGRVIGSVFRETYWEPEEVGSKKHIRTGTSQLIIDNTNPEERQIIENLLQQPSYKGS